MKKTVLLLLFLLSLSSLVRSQQIIVIPNDSAEITTNVTNEFDPIDVHIWVINNTGSAANFMWGLIDYTAPPEWEIGLCDNNNCYFLSSAPGPYESLIVNAGDTMDMKLQYAAHCVSGTGNTNVYAHITGDSATTVVFLNYRANLTSNCPSGIADNSSRDNLRLYPNPVQGSFIVEGFENSNKLSCKVYDAIGVEMKTKILRNSESQIEISVEKLPAGEYILKAFDSFGKTVGTTRLSKVD